MTNTNLEEKNHPTSGERFQHIKEMIHLEEDDVSASFEPHEADDGGLPLMLMLLFGIAIIGASVMALLFFTVGTTTVQTVMGNHFLK